MSCNSLSSDQIKSDHLKDGVRELGGLGACLGSHMLLFAPD